jgi:hypothetical protein
MGIMNIDDLMAMVDADLGKPLRRDHIEWEASRNQSLHQKYRKLLYHEKLDLDSMKAKIKSLVLYKTEYYLGKAPDHVYKARPFDLKIKPIKSELGPYLDADPELMEAYGLISAQAEKVELIKDTLDDIRRRTFSQGIILNSQRFKHGLENLGQVLDMSDPDWES